ncbi:replicative DNA helicase loader DnaI [Ligilactobacillus sp. WC1T17]|uniref:Replicative DNA helicase loader DnaI n=1 Tax=Ligilactobacillus ruminis TaxID=1623 RepID=A0ABY1A9N4_9LACO|nr:replicative DNA helicase loader DnaI [Ligilactobacillus ruminis]
MENVGAQMGKLLQQKGWNQKVQAISQKVIKDPDIAAFLQENVSEITPQIIQRDLSQLLEYLHFKNDYQAGKETLMPGYYPELLFSNHQIEIVYRPTQKSKQEQAQKKLAQRVKAISLPKAIKNASLQDYFTSTPERIDALTAAMSFVRDYSQDPGIFHQGLYLQGDFGVGKTYLLAAIANDLAKKGFASTIVHLPTFILDLKGLIGSKSKSITQAINEVKKAPILMLDDIGADTLSAWSRDEIIGVILQYRMQEELPTFFSSNYKMDELENNYLAVNNRQEFEPVKAKRIMERIRFLAKEVTVLGPNLRNP